MRYDRPMRELLLHHIMHTKPEVTIGMLPNLLIEEISVHEIFHDGLLAQHPKYGRIIIPFTSIAFIRL